MNFSAGNARELIDGRFLEHEKLVHRVMGSKKLMKDLEDAAGLMKMTLLSGNKIMFCGNGGSAADAQHWAAEIVGRFQKGTGWYGRPCPDDGYVNPDRCR